MAFAQLTYRESLRDIEACLRAVQSKLFHLGIRARVARSTIADGNETRDWRIHADVAHGLIRAARVLYVDKPLAVDLADTVYALDASVLPRREPAWRAAARKASEGGRSGRGTMRHAQPRVPGSRRSG